jgi:hypothetical protein
MRMADLRAGLDPKRSIMNGSEVEDIVLAAWIRAIERIIADVCVEVDIILVAHRIDLQESAELR